MVQLRELRNEPLQRNSALQEECRFLVMMQKQPGGYK